VRRIRRQVRRSKSVLDISVRSGFPLPIADIDWLQLAPSRRSLIASGLAMSSKN
jgi:hypothetical protein